jgi:cell shape-determining protein MreC
MNDNSTRRLLIAILVVATLNLVTTGIQTAVTFRSTSGTPVVVAEGSQSLPKQYTATALAEIANRIVAPYNLQEADAFYNTFDDIAKNQISREKFDKQLAELFHLVGKVESSSFSGSQKQQQTQGRLDMYTLNYVVKLSGTNLQTGVMSIIVVDREPKAGIVGFFINGRTQQ